MSDSSAMPRRSSGATTIWSARTRLAISSRLPDVESIRISRVGRETWIDAAETFLMHERHVVLQMLALAAQNPVEIPGALTRPDHQKMGTKELVMAQRPKHQAREHGASGETQDRSDEKGRRNHRPESCSQDVRCSHADGNDERHAAERTRRVGDAVSAVKTEREEKNEIHDAEDVGLEQSVSCAGHIHGQPQRDRPNDRDQHCIDDEEGRAGRQDSRPHPCRRADRLRLHAARPCAARGHAFGSRGRLASRRGKLRVTPVIVTPLARIRRSWIVR